MRKTALRSFFTLCLGAAALTSVQAQRKWVNYVEPDFSEPIGWSLGVNVGLADLWGDVGTKSMIDHYINEKYWSKPHFMGGIYLRYTPRPAYAFRLGTNYGTLYAHDNYNYTKAQKANSIEDESYQRWFRNQDARVRTWEGSFLIELNPRRFNPESRAARRRFQPYLMAGIAAFNFKTQTSYKPRLGGGAERWVDVYDLHLEGDGFKGADGNPLDGAPATYQRWQLAIPMGIGVRWDIGRQLGLGVEYQYRYTFTDYLDGVSDKYINPALFDANLPAKDAAIAKDVYDKSWQIDPTAKHNPGEIRGNKSVNDGYSTFSINFFWKIKSRKSPWWF